VAPRSPSPEPPGGTLGLAGSRGTHLHEDEDHKGDEDIGAGVVPGLQDAQVFKLIADTLLGPCLVVEECYQGVLLGELVRGRGQLGLVVTLGWGLVCHPTAGTWPAMNCPKPGGNVRVEISRVTRAGKSRRLQGCTGWGVILVQSWVHQPSAGDHQATYFFMRKRLMVFWRRMNCTILRLR